MSDCLRSRGHCHLGRKWGPWLASLVWLLVLPAQVADAQVSAGNVYGGATDDTGASLPGVTVELMGQTGTRATHSTEIGEFRFLDVQNGTYTVRASLTGFASLERGITVTTGQNTYVSFTMQLAGLAEEVVVSGQASLVDTRRVGTSTTLTSEEIHQVPNARDPWALLRTVPGVVVDRVNIAGNESGSQSFFVGKGNDGADNTFFVDGVLFENPTGLGTSPGYFDIGAFDEIAVTTGGANVQVQTGGVSLQFAIKRGTNQWRGLVRGYLTHDDLQWSNIGGTELDGDPRLQGSDKADHIQQINDYGFEVGGPIVKDELFAFLSYGKQDIRLVRTNQTADKTILTNWNAKLTWQASPSTTASLFYFDPRKSKDGRSIGLGLQWEESGLLAQRDVNPDGYLPFIGLAKFELSHIFSPDLFVNLKYSTRDAGVRLTPEGGTTTGGTLDFFGGVGRGAVLGVASDIISKHNTTIDGSYFVSGWGGGHELKFGFGYRKDLASSGFVWGGEPGLVGVVSGPEQSVVQVYRGAPLRFESDTVHLYVGDTFTRDRWTLAAGLRFDRRTAENSPSSVSAQSSFPDLLPAIDFAGGGVGIRWSDVSPRLSASYALGDARRTVVRASFARYASRLNPNATTFDNPLSVSQLTYLWNDANADGLPQPEEVLVDGPLLGSAGVDPEIPGSVESVDTIDPNYSAPRESELVFGLDHELAPNLAVSAAYTWRRRTGNRSGYGIGTGPGWTPRLGLSSVDYTPNPPVTANGFTAQTYSPDPDLVAATGGGRILTNRPDYEVAFQGFEASLIKRMADGWMTRAAFTYGDAEERYLGPGAVQNPTRTDTPEPGGISGPQVDGGQQAPISSGSGKGDIFTSAKWQISASALYEVGRGFEVSAALYGRQGFVRPIVMSIPAGLDGPVRALATSTIDAERYPNLWNLDLRAAKTIRLGGERALVLSLDLFNIFNGNTELNRFRQANSQAFGRLDEILSPRILRLGAILRF